MVCKVAISTAAPAMRPEVRQLWNSCRNTIQHCRATHQDTTECARSMPRHVLLGRLELLPLAALTRARPLTLSGRVLQSCASDSLQPEQARSTSASHSGPWPLADSDTTASGPHLRRRSVCRWESASVLARAAWAASSCSGGMPGRDDCITGRDGHRRHNAHARMIQPS